MTDNTDSFFAEEESADEVSSEVSNRRSRFRLRMPRGAMLSVAIDAAAYDVIEIAEHSIVVTSKYVINKDGICSGEITWSDDTTSIFTGEVGRLSERGRVIFKVQGISTAKVLNEQRKLLKSFPAIVENFRFEIFNPNR